MSEEIKQVLSAEKRRILSWECKRRVLLTSSRLLKGTFHNCPKAELPTTAGSILWLSR